MPFISNGLHKIGVLANVKQFDPVNLRSISGGHRAEGLGEVLEDLEVVVDGVELVRGIFAESLLDEERCHCVYLGIGMYFGNLSSKSLITSVDNSIAYLDLRRQVFDIYDHVHTGIGRIVDTRSLSNAEEKA